MMKDVILPEKGVYARFFPRIWLCSQSVAHFSGDEKQKNSIPLLDGVRAIACLSIITFHMNLLACFHGIWNPALDGAGAFGSAMALSGESGVILFFVLSGFLLFLPYAKSMLFDSDWPSLRRFYMRRVFRVVPGYYVALCLMTLFVAPEYLRQVNLHNLWLFLTFRMDFPQTFQRLNSPFWTLALEFQFYIILPCIAWMMRLVIRRGALSWRVAKLTFCLLVVLAWGLGTRYWGAFLSGTPTLDFLVPHSIADGLKPYIYGTDGKFLETFVVGMLICTLYTYVQYTSVRERLQRYLFSVSLLLFGIGLCILVLMSLWHFHRLYMDETFRFLTPYEPLLLTYWDLVYPLCYAIGYGLCMFALLYGPAWLKRPFTWRPLRWLGLISYSLYMWHYPIILHFLSSFLPKFQSLGWSQTAQGGVYWLWLLLVAFPISIVLYRVIEIPGIRVGERLCQRWLEQKTRQKTIAVNELAEQAPINELAEHVPVTRH
jgi:peptidoglycan/LPS O-acetylase OafA/YrhL